jgi:hypothetical protein
MGKWAKALIIGLIIFVVVAGCLFLFSTLMARQVARWQAAGTALSGVQIFAVRIAFLFMQRWFTIIPLLVLLCFGIPLLVAATRK